MEKETKKNQYHPAFCAAMELELREDRNHLMFEKEYNLNTKPNSIDFLVINVDDNIKVKSELGSIFRKHNIFEFKSPGDSLNYKVYQRTVGYAYLYCAYGGNTESVKDMTISFIREKYPRKLMSWFSENGFDIVRFRPGIYHIKKTNHIDMQMIVTRQLADTYVWINKLTSKLEKKDMLQFRDEFIKLKNEKDMLNAESVMDFSLKLNENKDYIRELNGMGALRDLFKEDFEERDNKIKDLSEQLQTQSEQLQTKEEQLQTIDNELKSEKEKNKKLQTKLKDLEEQVVKLSNKIAML